MDLFFIFLKDNALLLIAALIILMLYFWDDDAYRYGIKQINAAKLTTLINQGILVLDIREQAVFKAGHIQGSQHISGIELPTLRERKQVVLLADDAQQAEKEAIKIKKTHAGIQVCLLRGGLSQWKAEGLPLVT